MAGKLTPEVQALALQGTLDTFSLPDVLRLLATTSKTGRLRIDGDRGLGSVWLAEGGIVDADADRAIDGTPTDEVIFELLRFDAGSFAFDGDDTASSGGEPEDVEALLRRANALLSEWAELETVVPSLTHEVTLSSDLSVEQVTIDSDRWRTLVAVASGRTVGELASALSLKLTLRNVVHDAVAGDVVERFLLADVLGLLADHEGEFHLPVRLLRRTRNLDVVVGSHDATRRLHEDHRLRWHGQVRFRGMIGIVEADTDELADIADAGAQAGARRHLRQGRGINGAEACDGAGACQAASPPGPARGAR